MARDGSLPLSLATVVRWSSASEKSYHFRGVIPLRILGLGIVIALDVSAQGVKDFRNDNLGCVGVVHDFDSRAARSRYCAFLSIRSWKCDKSRSRRSIPQPTG